MLKRDELIEELRRIAREIGKKDDKIVKIVLFGSLAEGRAVPGSDADVLILLKNFPVEVFPYTINEVNPLVEEVLKKGIWLFERKSD